MIALTLICFVTAGFIIGFIAAAFGIQRASGISDGAFDVIAERDRQTTEERWSNLRDDSYPPAQLAHAGACYALRAFDDPSSQMPSVPMSWPWHRSWWKPKDPRRNLVRAAALIIAEIDKLDRLEERRRIRANL